MPFSTLGDDGRRPPATCRQAGCSAAAVSSASFCVGHGLAYLRWRATRDELERQCLAALGHRPGDPLDERLILALDLLFGLLLPPPPTQPL